MRPRSNLSQRPKPWSPAKVKSPNKTKTLSIIASVVIASTIALSLLYPKPTPLPEKAVPENHTAHRSPTTHCDQKQDWMSCYQSLYASTPARKTFEFSAPPDPIETTTRNFRTTFTIQNLESRVAKTFEIWCYLPMTGIPGQTLLETKLSHPAKLATDSLGHRILYFNLGPVAPNETRILRLFHRVSMNQKSPLTDHPPSPRFTEPEPLIESQSEIIQKTASRILGDGAQKKAKNIYFWIRNNISPLPLDGKDHGALHAISHKKGDCTEMALLFTALCRASGIPARAVTGYRLDQDRAVDARDLHNWAQFHAQGKWHMADPHAGNFMENTWQYITLEIFSSTHKNPVQDYHHFRYTTAKDIRFSVRH